MKPALMSCLEDMAVATITVTLPPTVAATDDRIVGRIVTNGYYRGVVTRATAVHAWVKWHHDPREFRMTRDAVVRALRRGFGVCRPQSNAIGMARTRTVDKPRYATLEDGTIACIGKLSSGGYGIMRNK